MPDMAKAQKIDAGHNNKIQMKENPEWELRHDWALDPSKAKGTRELEIDQAMSKNG